MVIVEFLQTILSSVLIGYLSFTNGIADRIIAITDTDSPDVTTEISITTKESAEQNGNLEHIASNYTQRETIPQILLENATYQKAALGSGLRNEPIELFEREKTLEERIADALVNVYCVYKTETHQRTTTGSGFFIHKDGVVLTNAHVAQFLLLEDIEPIQDVRCVLRGGAPAAPLYEAKLLYLSPAWISQNANLISEEKPAGTGERDYALLYVSDTATDDPLPETFPALSIDTSLVPRTLKNNAVYAGGYPVTITENRIAALSPIVATTTVAELYTFGSNYADLFSIRESLVGEQGASGGPVLREDGNVIGLIVTKGDNGTEGPMSLRALTASYINRTILEETGFSLTETMQGDLAYRSELFNEILAPFLSRILENQFE